MQLGLLDDNDLKNVNYSDLGVHDKTFSKYGFDYNYSSDTEDEQKYVHEKNRTFLTFNKSKKK